MWSSSSLVQFQNCYLLRNGSLVKDDLWVRNKTIINPEPVFYDERAIADIQVDCQGAIISPGYIDLQINGGFGIDFSHNVDKIEKGLHTVAHGILKHGVTSFCPTIVTSHVDVYKIVTSKVKKTDGSKEGAGILGLHLEGPFINRKRKGAHNVQHIRQIDSGFSEILNVYGDLKNVAMVTLAPEVDKTGEVIRELVKLGVTVSIGHSEANLVEGEKAMQQGASFITHLFNAMLPFHHRDPGLVGLLTSKKLPEEKNAYYGIIADGIHTHPAALRIAYKANFRGLTLVTDAMSALGLEAGTHFIGDMKVDIKDQKAFIAGTETLCGSIATMDTCVRFFKKSSRCTTVEALECATLHPAEVLGVSERKGTLNFGSDADFLLLDESLNVLSTWIAGDCVWEKAPGSLIFHQQNSVKRS